MADTKVDQAIQVYQVQVGLLTDWGIDVASRTFNLTGEIDEEMFKRVDMCMTMLENDNRKGITIRLNSAGGSVTETMAIIGRLRSSPCKVTIEAYGVVASGAFNILASGHRRKMSPLCQAMHHEASMSLGDESVRVSELQALTKQARKDERVRAEMMAKFSNASVDFWLEEGTKTDRYFTPEELLDLGVIDEVMKL